ncbi:hypothetical protein VCHENC02_2745 [Vibrio harveyi]|uniref:Uncharacterized protein n=1 Tax=Vibrio harveyi TaxID=669 RepID=A0A454CZ10_VIBHA|nr:hypothetical protein VCHENC01_3453 [Vibrio harveyi]EKM31634.1 hypothetical protein VCHENC02_2745 [Vibrio harveyi]
MGRGDRLIHNFLTNNREASAENPSQRLLKIEGVKSYNQPRSL